MTRINTMIGKRFGRLVVIAISEIVRFKKTSDRKYLCKCSCGNEIFVMRSNLSSGNTKSCGCLTKDGLRDFVVGKRYGRLLVVSKAEIVKFRKGAQRKYLCKCDCGNEIAVLSSNLKNNSTRSCGCLNQECRINNNTTHGMSYTRIHRIWRGMKGRCNVSKNPRYSDYGGRGITYDKKWETFEGFFEDMGVSYEEELSLERTDCNGNYCKENCTWIPLKEQAKNTRKSRFLEYKGKKLILADWANLLSKKYNVGFYRVKYYLYYKNLSIVEIVRKLEEV